MFAVFNTVFHTICRSMYEPQAVTSMIRLHIFKSFTNTKRNQGMYIKWSIITLSGCVNVECSINLMSVCTENVLFSPAVMTLISFSSTNDTSAYMNLARVFVQRCMESGILEVRCDLKPHPGGKVSQNTSI